MLTQDIWTAVVAFLIFLVACALMWLGWRGRTRRQEGLVGPLAAPPADPGTATLGPLTGVYIGTTTADDWQNRIAQNPLGFRSGGTIALYPDGVLLDLDGGQIWIPETDIVSVRQDSRLANKVVPGKGILVVQWNAPGQDGPIALDTGFRADDKDSYPEWTALKENL